jgi:ribosome-binding protein aMBF1 (putative translation factor)
MRMENSAKTTAYRVCSWCGSLLGVKTWPSAWEESTITHGVCQPCMRQVRHQTRQVPSAAAEAAQRQDDTAARDHQTRRTDRSEPAPAW